MAIIIKFDSINELNSFIASAVARTDTYPFPHHTDHDDSSPAPTFDAAPVTEGTRINTDNIDVLLDVGDRVHWHGAKFTFDGVVEDTTADIGDDDKVVFIRRDDTGKLVSLTNSDIDLYSLFKLAA